jgi:hypothetical protein
MEATLGEPAILITDRKISALADPCRPSRSRINR